MEDITKVVRKFGVCVKVSIPERGCEFQHWQAEKWESQKGSGDSDVPQAAAKGNESPGSRRHSTKLQLTDFEIGRILGEGNYSRVFLGTLKSTNEQLAVKVIEKKKLERYKKQAEALMEKHILSTYQHPFMVRLYHTFQDRQCLYIVTEFVPGGELWNMSHRTGLRLSLATFYAAELLDVMEYLHANQVVHRDLKPENVLISANGHIKLIDFGTAKTLGDDAMDTSGNFKFGRNFKEFVGTAEYMPPEAINNKPADFRADLWSFGGTVYQLVTGQPPFKGGSEYLTLKRVLELKYRFPAGMPDDARDLIQSLLQIEPNLRLGGGSTSSERHEAIKRHRFFELITWDRLHEQEVPQASPEEIATPTFAMKLQMCPQVDLPEAVELPPMPPPPEKRTKKRGPTEEECAKAVEDRKRAEAQMAARAQHVKELVEVSALAAAAGTLSGNEQRQVAFYLDVRGLLNEDMRIALHMPDPEPDIVDDIEPLPDSSDDES